MREVLGGNEVLSPPWEAEAPALGPALRQGLVLTTDTALALEGFFAWLERAGCSLSQVGGGNVKPVSCIRCCNSHRA